MDSPAASAADDPPRVKFLCSFGGSILPRPLDGRLRYVGGETRIVSVPRDVAFPDLVSRMRELFDSATVIKYQQPDEDLDALVSVVNEDDVVNMMEEYDKLSAAAGDGFTRLRIFLFSQQQPDLDSAAVAAHFDADSLETERRYVDALNSLSPPSPDTDLHYQPSWSPYFSPRYHGEFTEGDWNPPAMPIPEKSGFPTNLGHTHAMFDGGSVCEHCRMALRPPMYADPRRQPVYMEQAGSNSCNECSNHRREGYSLNQDAKVDYTAAAPCPDRSWILHHHQGEDPRSRHSGSGYAADGNAMNASFWHGNFYDAHTMPSNFINYEDTRYLRPGGEFGSEMFHPQLPVGGSPQPQFAPSPTDNLYQVAQNLPPIQSIRRKAQVPMRPGTSYESSGLMVPNGGMNSGFTRSPSPSPQDISPRLSRMAMENQIQSSRVGQNGSSSQKILVVDVGTPDYVYDHGSRSNRNVITEEKHAVVEGYQEQNEDNGKESDVQASSSPNVDVNSPGVVSAEATATNEEGDVPVECLSILPELIASVKKAALESAEVVRARAEADVDEVDLAITDKKEAASHELEPEVVDVVSDSDVDGEHRKISKIEPTTAESEALAKGLQTIRNDDLEEIRQLGSGTYGSVFHGKWKGSDVAIKRIKASCFAGRPSERERLIADFWKEALILSSLHHPNVVSFYGVVRDGPDGSLATVTEFMVNGSLKQFLQKKDRTIDRRKRLIIAMDAAFGMEYLHGKNIVHFDLKCENLLVNMRDPHRPICKIGDLGLSKVKQHTLVSGGVRGTLPWMAPELLSGKCHMVTEKIDVYSFGIAMWELLTGEDPYADMHCASMIGGIVNNTLRPQVPTWCDPEWKAMMESCWSSEPGERPSFAEVSQKLRKMAAAINVK